MKRLEDYTNNELLDLDDEAIDRLIDLECAEEGARLLPAKFPEPPEAVDVTPDAHVWEFFGILFEDQLAAERVRDAVVRERVLEPYYLRGEYAWEGPKGVRHKDPESIPSVVRRTYWSEIKYVTHKAEIESAKKAKEVYEKQIAEYREIEAERKEIVERVHERLNAARFEESRRRSVRAAFQEYLDIAGHDNSVAMRFFLKAHPDWSEHEVAEICEIPMGAR